MSQVIGFRLDQDNPREAQALALLEAWQKRGYSTRYIITEALLQLDGKTESEVSSTVAELQKALDHAHRLLERMQNGQIASPQHQAEDQPEQAQLTESFVLSVKEAARSGMTLE
jgi:hypothetical protein